MTYTEEQVKELIKKNIALQEKVASLEKTVAVEKCRADSAEENFKAMSARCIDLFVTHKNIGIDSIVVDVRVPKFMSQDDLSIALAESIKNLVLQERECICKSLK